MKNVLWLLLAIILIFKFTTLVIASSSDYVLPYPPIMPGGMLYKIRVVYEEIDKYWHFGSLSQFTYNLKQSDKYLVQTKTLLEYKQYQLGAESLQKSNDYFEKAKHWLLRAQKEEKPIEEKRQIIVAAGKKHAEVLEALLVSVPDVVKWSPEKTTPTTIFLHKNIIDAIETRKN